MEDEFGSNCTIAQRETVLAFTLAVTDETFISDVNATITPGIVSHNKVDIMVSTIISYFFLDWWWFFKSPRRVFRNTSIESHI